MSATPLGSQPLVSLLWTQRQDIGPSARFGHALAYDAAGAERCSWEATRSARCSTTRGSGTERRGRRWRTSGHQGAPLTRSPTTLLASVSCSSAAGTRARSPTRGSGTAQRGPRSRTRGRRHAAGMRSHTTQGARASCCSAVRTRRPLSWATRGSGTATSGRRSPTPARRPAPVTRCASTPRAHGRSSTEGPSPPTRGRGTVRSGPG